jgi:putative DNA modification/repair radical SAM protein
MDMREKLEILADAAKYDVACTSSGSNKKAGRGGIGSTMAPGCCHSFTADGRCVSLLKVLLTNICIHDCKYCVNRRSNDTRRAAFTPEELAELTMQFYRRNYIEGLFISSGVFRSPDYTCEQIIRTIEILRFRYQFHGYIHAKAIPGADPRLIERLGLLADRLSVNIELPSAHSLSVLAPDKSKQAILAPMRQIGDGIAENRQDIVRYRHAPQFAPAGQSTQMIVGASPESDYQILMLSEALYRKYALKRVFFSAYVPVVEDPALPGKEVRPPLLREHRLYQADWLLRFYGFTAEEILDEAHPFFDPWLDPKCNWALSHPAFFPVEVNTAPQEVLLRVPGIGVRSARRILEARRCGSLDFAGLKKIGVVLKRAQYFITCRGKMMDYLKFSPETARLALSSERSAAELPGHQPEQLTMF